MRINLVTPFAEKDAVKALGARWDPAKKVWYINDVADLTPFQRWIPDRKTATGGDAGQRGKHSRGRAQSPLAHAAQATGIGRAALRLPGTALGILRPYASAALTSIARLLASCCAPAQDAVE